MTLPGSLALVSYCWCNAWLGECGFIFSILARVALHPSFHSFVALEAWVLWGCCQIFSALIGRKSMTEAHPACAFWISLFATIESVFVFLQSKLPSTAL